MGFDCNRLNEVDDDDKGGLHYYLDKDDRCFYLGDYIAGVGYEVGGLNQAILNLKKKPSSEIQNPAAYKYKKRAILEIAHCMREQFKDEVIRKKITFVPIPPSKAKDHPDYDDRMWQICRLIAGSNGDARELIVNSLSTDATHSDEHKPRPEELATQYDLQLQHDYAPRPVILLVDDLLTTGSHYVACRMLLQEAYPDVQICGLFAARRVITAS